MNKLKDLLTYFLTKYYGNILRQALRLQILIPQGMKQIMMVYQ